LVEGYGDACDAAGCAIEWGESVRIIELQLLIEVGSNMKNFSALSLFLLSNMACISISIPIYAQSTNECSGHGPETGGNFEDAIPVTSPRDGLPLHVGKTGINGTGKTKSGKTVNTLTRCIFFVDVNSKPAKTDKPRQTWVVIHGWDDDSKGDMNEVAKKVAEKNPGDRVLLLDWSEASRNAGDDGANPLGINEKLSRGNYYAASWIAPVAEVVVEQLKARYGISAIEAEESLNLVGHSLGSILSAQIGKEFKKNGNQSGVSTITALDPASETNLKSFVGKIIGDLGGYDVDGRSPAYIYKGRPQIAGITISPFEQRDLVPDQRQAPEDFRNAAKFSRAYVGVRSFAGNKELAASAHETFQMDFGSIVDWGDEHIKVVKTFANLIDPKKKYFGSILDINNNNAIKGILAEEYIDGSEGIIGVSSDNIPDELGLTLKGKGPRTISSDGQVFDGTISGRGGFKEFDRGVKGLGRIIGGIFVESSKVDQVFESPIRREPTDITGNSWSQVSIIQNQLTSITQGGSTHIGSAAYYFGRSVNNDKLDTNEDITARLHQVNSPRPQSLQRSAEFLPGDSITNLKAPVDIVLDWNQSAKLLDLDSHLTGPVPLGEDNSIRFHIRYDEQGSTTKAPFAELYKDVRPDMGTFGKEQTRIQNLQKNGVYRFYVHDYTNREATYSTDLSGSGANVSVYNGLGISTDQARETLGSQIGSTLFVPTNQNGNVWYVLQLDSKTGILRRVNVPFIYESDRARVPRIGEPSP
jgi:Lipase